MDPIERRPSSETYGQEKTDIDIRQFLREIGIDPERVAIHIIERLQLLEERTKFIGDSERSILHAKQIFAYYKHNAPEKSFSDIEKRTVIAGALFADIGKSGPANASPEEQKFIADMFAVENVMNEKMPVRKFFEEHFSADAAERIEKFQAMGLDPAMTMREFWNKHSPWTLEILRSERRIPSEAIAAAAAHHALENVNPEDIIGNDERFTQYFGENAAFDRAEKLVILLDKYDAARRRGGKNHAEAIEIVRKILGRNSRYAADREFRELIEDMERALG